MRTSLTTDKKLRISHMKNFGDWLKENGRTQRWAASRLGIYHGYLSNLVTGKQVASEETCLAAGKLMGPLDADTGKPAGTGWTNVEWQNERDRKRRKKIERAERKKEKRITTWEVPKAALSESALGSPAPRRHPGRLTPAEMIAVGDVVVLCIKSMPVMTGDALLDVIDAVRTGLTT